VFVRRESMGDVTAAHGFCTASSTSTGSPKGLRYEFVIPASVAQGFSPACTRHEIRIILHPEASGRVGRRW
jgi:hypothetical protein